ncbi:helix-turn-helix domain-containing protein [Pedobacter frigiditerrae]|uniref:Helix-turn-helix domain-containing protein n=2 Tax=Pedobacter frigiditerrae TaxID=2530452 RepID=A0A4R0MNC7_9SPHI|nr:helix-turn-helix domain-containing protein [Pedobacter frigiditerrae]
MTKADMKNVLGEEIRKYRDQSCYTQEYMASELGIGQSAYQKIESGVVNISMERLMKIAKILGKPIDVFTGSGERINDSSSNVKTINVSEREWSLTQKIILQQEKRIEELESKLQRRDDKIWELKQKLDLA